MAKRLDILGKKFHRIEIIEDLGFLNGEYWWKYKCLCGNVKQASTSTLNAGRLKSCGCLKKEIIGAKNRQNLGQSAKTRLITIYKNRAKKKGYSWELTEAQFFALTEQNCHYCGVPPQNDTTKISPHSFGSIKFNGVDRVNNDLGYVVDNCVPCCRNCNLAKCNFTYQQFKTWISRLIDFNKGK